LVYGFDKILAFFLEPSLILIDLICFISTLWERNLLLHTRACFSWITFRKIVLVYEVGLNKHDFDVRCALHVTTQGDRGKIN